ncbi:MAG: NFACT family protein, partial [Bacillota bacterium]
MRFDGLIMAAIASEFRRTLIGARVDKIYQPSRLELVMTMRQPGRSITIIASAQPTAARVHITETVRENPPVPPAFCMLLRKHLIGSRVREIEQLGLDRVLKITFMRSSEDVPKTLVIEVMGRHSNIALIDGDTNMILDSIKHIGADLSRVRQMGPGIQYVNPPAQDKLNILLCSEEDLDDVLGKAQENTPSMSLGRVLVSSLAGFGLGSADRVLREAGIEPAKPCRDLD